MMVVMALVTTLMTAPLLNLVLGGSSTRALRHDTVKANL
jgi:hypothetical protein